jgi:hypothetical protein
VARGCGSSAWTSRPPDRGRDATSGARRQEAGNPYTFAIALTSSVRSASEIARRLPGGSRQQRHPPLGHSALLDHRLGYDCATWATAAASALSTAAVIRSGAQHADGTRRPQGSRRRARPANPPWCRGPRGWPVGRPLRDRDLRGEVRQELRRGPGNASVTEAVAVAGITGVADAVAISVGLVRHTRALVGGVEHPAARRSIDSVPPPWPG